MNEQRGKARQFGDAVSMIKTGMRARSLREPAAPDGSLRHPPDLCAGRTAELVEL